MRKCLHRKPKRNESLLRDYLAGMTYARLAVKYDLAETRVYHLVKRESARAGVGLRGRVKKPKA